MKDKVNKFLEIEDRVFRAPYNYLKEKGIIDKVIELKARFVEIYEKDEHIPYGGNQMFFGDDWTVFFTQYGQYSLILKSGEAFSSADSGSLHI